MREMKFRAWDEEEKKMIYGLNEILNEWDLFKHDVDALFDGSNPVMQSIGLKDDNNREIYEGDIMWFEFDGCKGKGVIEWDEEQCMFYVNAYKEYHVFIAGADLDYCKKRVIGNVFEGEAVNA